MRVGEAVVVPTKCTKSEAVFGKRASVKKVSGIQNLRWSCRMADLTLA
jgi:hypothetical protein